MKATSRLRLSVSAACATFIILSQPALAYVGTSESTSLGAAGADTVLVVWDTASNVAYVRDLQEVWNPSTASTVFGSNLSFTGDSNWSTFLSDNGGLDATTRWGIYSSYSFGAVGEQLAGTVSASTPTMSTYYQSTDKSLLSSTWNTVVDNASEYYSNPGFTLGSTIDGGGSVVTTGSQKLMASWLGGYGQASPNFFAYLDNPNNPSLTSNTLNFWGLTAGSVPTAKETPSSLGGVWSFNTTTGGLTYTVAVPEPASSWEVVAGLLVLVSLLRSKSLRRPG